MLINEVLLKFSSCFISFLLLFALVALHYQRKRWAYCLIISAIIISNYFIYNAFNDPDYFAIIGKYPLSVQINYSSTNHKQLWILGGGFVGVDIIININQEVASTARLQYGAYLLNKTRLPIGFIRNESPMV